MWPNSKKSSILFRNFPHKPLTWTDCIVEKFLAAFLTFKTFSGNLVPRFPIFKILFVTVQFGFFPEKQNQACYTYFHLLFISKLSFEEHNRFLLWFSKFIKISKSIRWQSHCFLCCSCVWTLYFKPRFVRKIFKAKGEEEDETMPLIVATTLPL